MFEINICFWKLNNFAINISFGSLLSFLRKWSVCFRMMHVEYFGYKCIFEMFLVEHSNMGHIVTGYVAFSISMLCQSLSYRGKRVTMYLARYILCSVWWRSSPFCFCLLWSHWVLNYRLKMFWTTLCKTLEFILKIL